MAKQLSYQVMHEIFSRFREAEAEPKGELNHVNAYTLVVAVALSAQATDAGVNRATAALFEAADTPQKMLDLGEEAVIDHIKTIGLFRQKAKNVMKMSQILVDEYDSIVPSSRAVGIARCRAKFLNLTGRRGASDEAICVVIGAVRVPAGSAVLRSRPSDPRSMTRSRHQLSCEFGRFGPEGIVRVSVGLVHTRMVRGLPRRALPARR